MTDDKKPREWIVPAEWQVSGKKFDAAATVRVVEGSAYDSLAERLKVAEAELLNTKELSSKLVEENAALKSMCEKLAVALKPWASVESDCGDDFSGVHEGVILRVECIAGNIHDAREALAEWKEFKK